MSSNGFLLISVVLGFIAVFLLDFTQQKSRGGLHLEFGNVIRQELTSVKSTDPEVDEVLEYVKQYARKRFPWSVPRAQGKTETRPEVIGLRKERLIYSHDDKNPIYYDDTIEDRTGQEYGVTSLITLGTAYKFLLRWSEEKLIFTHSFNVTLYPAKSLNVYSHSFYIQNKNDSQSQVEKYLIPKYHNWRVAEKVQSLKPSDLYHHINEDLFEYTAKDDGKGDHVTVSGQSEACFDESCSYGDESKGEFKYAKFFSKQFTVMTYNIWNMNAASSRQDGYERRMAHLKETILLADPDIIGLQEVRYEEAKGGTLGPSQVETLSEGLPQYQFVYQPAQMQPNTPSDGKTEEGVAIFSKYPIVSHDYLLLYMIIYSDVASLLISRCVRDVLEFINRSDPADTHQRVLLHAQVYIPAVGKVHILNTHLSLTHVAREKCMVQIWKYARDLEGPVILMGDLNAEPQEPAVQYLMGKDVLSGEERSQFVDVWQEHNPYQGTGMTYNVLENNNTKRIDYIFYKAGSGCCKTDKIEVLDDGMRGSKAASDHMPVMATFSIEDHLKAK